ncbi:MAG: protein rep, partial [Desulfobacterales bacterium]|nr:protein rep [Desulfobacterales bacterium]
CQGQSEGFPSLVHTLGITSSQVAAAKEGTTPDEAVNRQGWSYEEFISKTNDIFEENCEKSDENADFHGGQPRGEIARELWNEGLYDEHSKWTNCQHKVWPFKCLDCGNEFYVPFRCDLRICPQCNQRYANLFRARYLPVIKKLMERKKGKDRLMLLTLTTKNTGEIPGPAEIKAHNKAIGKLMKMPLRDKNGKVIKDKNGKPIKVFKGGVSANEVKGTYLHSHCIIYGRYVPQEALSKEWQALTGNEVVDIREINQKARDVANYVSKYLKKPYRYDNSEIGVSLGVQFLKSFRGVRRVHSFGIFYAANHKDKKYEWCCPFCESKAVILQWSKFKNDWNVRDCIRSGTPSHKEVLGKWHEASINQWARA